MKTEEKKNQDVQLIAFKGLGEKEINALYKNIPIKKLQPNQILIKEGDIDQAVYIILSGKLKIVKNINGQTNTIATLQAGQWLGEIAFVRQVPRAASAIAIEPTTVMAFDRNTIHSLDDRTQLFFYKRLFSLSVERVKHLEKTQKALANKNKHLMDDIFSERVQVKADFRTSETIQGIIKKIPKLPIFASGLTSKLMGARASASEVAEDVKNDPSLVGIVLKTVNSAYYSFQKKVSDIQHAIVLLGFNEIYNMIIAEGVRETMPNTLSFRELHAHSVAISNIAYSISNRIKIGKPSELATIGLLHDVGQIVIELLKERNPKMAVFIASLDKSQMGSLLLETWNLPEVLWRTVEFMPYPEFSTPDNIPEELRNNVILLYLAHLSYDLFLGRPGNTLPTSFLDENKRLIGLKDYSLYEIAKRCALPGLLQKITSLPAPLRKLIKEHIQRAKAEKTKNPLSSKEAVPAKT
jgi:HD-like signal output (HDOD) protein